MFYDRSEKMENSLGRSQISEFLGTSDKPTLHEKYNLTLLKVEYA